MRRILSAMFAAALCAACCVPAKAPAPSRSITKVLHADTDASIDDRAHIAQAADVWRQISKGRANLIVVFDLDPTSLENVRAHFEADHSLVHAIREDSDTAKILDGMFESHNVRPLAATTNLNDGTSFVFFIRDRIDDKYFYSVALHEFGHVLGFPDLASKGSIMSGVRSMLEPPVEAPSPEDMVLCRKAKLCDK
jgi:hypothetical protein